MVSMLTMAIIRLGAILPIISSPGRMGVTSSCSMVPVSRSRTTAAAVSVTVCICSSVAMMPGIRNHRSFRSGLYRMRTRVSSGRKL